MENKFMRVEEVAAELGVSASYERRAAGMGRQRQRACREAGAGYWSEHSHP